MQEYRIILIFLFTSAIKYSLIFLLKFLLLYNFILLYERLFINNLVFSYLQQLHAVLGWSTIIINSEQGKACVTTHFTIGSGCCSSKGNNASGESAGGGGVLPRPRA